MPALVLLVGDVKASPGETADALLKLWNGMGWQALLGLAVVVLLWKLIGAWGQKAAAPKTEVRVRLSEESVEELVRALKRITADGEKSVAPAKVTP